MGNIDQYEQSQIDMCNELLALPRVFHCENFRLISGLASTVRPTPCGVVLNPKGAQYKLPIPLLLGHNWLRPVGHVTGVKADKYGLWVEARVANGRLAWIDDAWDEIKAGALVDFSVLAQNAYKAHEFRDWQLGEVSVCISGHNPDAKILRVRELVRPTAVRLDGTGRRETVYRDARPETSPYYMGR